MDNSSVWAPSLTLMNQANIEQLHDAATTILRTTGLNVHHSEMRRKLSDAGARPGEGQRIHLPADMVERALSTAKRDIVIHNRLGEPVMPLGPHEIYFGTGSDLVFTRDIETTERRTAVIDDVGQSARLCDALNEIDFVMSAALPHDIPGDVEPWQYYALLCNTTKPIIMTIYSGLETLECMHEMACVVAGGDEAFRQNPNYILYGQFVSPLQHDPLAIERLIFCADHEIPLIYIPTIIPGASGPLTLAGSLALATAECLAGLVMHQTQHPGAPFVFGACVCQLDMRTMVFPYGSPEWRLNDLVMAELARHYGLPVFGTGGATDSKLVDAQAGAEYATSLLVAALAGTNLIHDVGYLDSGLTGSLESIVLGAEQIRWVKQFIKGLQVSDETLAIQAISGVGPGGHFLEHAHTLKHLRQTVWTPYVTDREEYDKWIVEGAKDYATRARKYATELMHSHQPQVVNESVRATLAELCNRRRPSERGA
ncbi:MAG: trimethylamine methyltransferase family protein [Anaerolineae bacterium]|nr:trimethylamine methyltransferase family protein [Anaerolineae bacterium]